MFLLTIFGSPDPSFKIIRTL